MATEPPPGIEGFIELPTLSHVETDRFCSTCGYNLAGQPVRRDPRTLLLLTMCPECGSYEPALHATTVAKTWLHRLLLLPTAAWAVLIVGLFAFAAWMVAIITYMTCWSLLNHVPQYDPQGSYAGFERLPPDWGPEDILLTVISTVGLSLTVSVFAMLNTAITPHWNRRAMRGFNTIWPLLVVFGNGVLFAVEQTYSGRESGWIWPVIIVFACAGMLSGAIAVTIGRPVVRLVLRLLLPARPRTLFSYLWIVDGKTPPSVKQR